MEGARALGVEVACLTPSVERFGLEPPFGTHTDALPGPLGALLAPLRPPPLEPELSAHGAPSRSAWRLYLHDEAGLAAARVVVQGASAQLAEGISEGVRASGLPWVRAQIGAPLRAVVRYGGASPLAVAMVAWRAARLGLEVAWERVWGAQEQEVWLYAPNPARRGERLRGSAPLWLWCDDAARAEPLRAALEAEGYDARLSVDADHLRDHPELQVGVSLGPLAEDPAEAERLQALVGALLTREGCDVARYPARVINAAHPLLLSLAPNDMHLRTLCVCVFLPLTAARSGTLRPRGGGSLARWSVGVDCDDDALADEAIAALRAAGFVYAARAPLGRGGHRLGLEVRWGEARAFPQVCLALWGALARLGAPRALEPRAEEAEGRWEEALHDPDALCVTVRAADLDPDRRLVRLRRVAGGVVVVLCAEGGDASPLARALAHLRPAALEVLEPSEWEPLLSTLPTPSRALSERAEGARGEGERGGGGGGLELARGGLALAWGEVRCGRVPIGLVAWILREVERCVGHRPALVRDARLSAQELWVLA